MLPRGPLDRATLAAVLRAFLVERRRHAQPSIQRDAWTAAMQRARHVRRPCVCRGRGTICGDSLHVDGVTTCSESEHAIPCPFLSRRDTGPV